MGHSGFAEVSKRFASLRAAFPDFAEGYRASVEVISRAGDHDQAEQIANEALMRWPNDAGIGLAVAKAATAKGDWRKALERYEIVKRIPGGAGLQAYSGIATCLIKLGDLDEAESLLAEAVKLHPNEKELQSAFATVAAELGNWNVAALRWAEACRLFPQEREFVKRHFEAQQASLGSDTVVSSNLQVANASPWTSLMMGFESLGGGDAQGCEFGLLQREFNAEPLGLLRWTSIEPEGLALALKERFAFFGSEETTKLSVWDYDRRREHVLHDTRYGTVSHTFVYEDQLSAEKMMSQARRRQKFLAAKLATDLEEGEKLFVYRKCSRSLTDDELLTLHDSFAGFPKSVFLYVQYETPQHPNGTVEIRRDGLMIGYMDRFLFAPSGERLTPATTSWLRLCQTAMETFRRLR